MHDGLHVQVINLDDSEDRLANILTLLAAAGLDFVRCPAVDGRGQTTLPGYVPMLAWLWFGKTLSGGEVGCYLSHLRAARAFLDSGLPFGLVLEDDATPEPGFAAALDALLGVLEAGRAPGWRLIHLGSAVQANYRHDLADLGHGVTLAACTDFPLASHAMLWSREGAASFLDRGRRVMGTVDNWMRTDMAVHGGGLCLVPPQATQGVAPSIIGAQEGIYDGKDKRGWFKLRATQRSRWRRWRGARRVARGSAAD